MYAHIDKRDVLDYNYSITAERGGKMEIKYEQKQQQKL